MDILTKFRSDCLRKGKHNVGIADTVQMKELTDLMGQIGEEKMAALAAIDEKYRERLTALQEELVMYMSLKL